MKHNSNTYDGVLFASSHTPSFKSGKQRESDLQNLHPSTRCQKRPKKSLLSSSSMRAGSQRTTGNKGKKQPLSSPMSNQRSKKRERFVSSRGRSKKNNGRSPPSSPAERGPSSIAAVRFNKLLQSIIRGESTAGSGRSSISHYGIARREHKGAQLAEDLLRERIANATIIQQQQNSKQLAAPTPTSWPSRNKGRTAKLLVDWKACSFDTVSFNLVMQAWARQRSKSAARHADDLLSLLLQLQQRQQQQLQSSSSSFASNQPRLRADSYSYSAVLHAHAKSGGKVRAAQRATDLLQQMMRSLSYSSNNVRLETDVCHNAAMDAWAVSGHDLAGERAEKILHELETLGLATVVSYNACIKAYARNGQALDAQRLLDTLNEKGTSILPDKVSYSTCIHAWANVAEKQDVNHKGLKSRIPSERKFDYSPAEKAGRLLKEMEDLYETTGDESLRPDVVVYTAVLAAMTRSQTSAINGHHIQQQYDKVKQLIGRLERYAGKPNAAFYNAWIHWMSKTASTKPSFAGDLAKEAESILSFMKAEDSIQQSVGNGSRGGVRSKANDLRPCKVTYTAVIAVLAQVGSVTAAERAVALLDELEGRWRASGRDSAYLPNAKTFASVLNALAKGASATNNNVSVINRADELLERMDRLYSETGHSEELRPNLIVFVQIFQILARVGDQEVAAVKAKELLERMNRLYLQGGHDDVRPDSTTMAYFLNTLTKSGVSNAVELATHIIEEVEEGYRSGMGHLKPTVLLYSAAMQAYAKSASREGAELAENLLQRTKEMYKAGKLYAKPSVLSYNAVIDAHARSNGGQRAAERAEALLQEMESRSRAGDSELKPNTRSFNGVILAWKNSNSTAEAPHRAEALLRQMFARYKAGNVECRPDRVTLNSVIGVWAKSNEEDALERGEEILRLMESKGKAFQPDRYTYNSLIDAYARRGAGRQANSLFERMEKLGGLAPDIITLTSLRNAWLRSEEADAKKECDRVGVLIAQHQNGTSRP